MDIFEELNKLKYGIKVAIQIDFVTISNWETPIIIENLLKTDTTIEKPLRRALMKYKDLENNVSN